MSNVFHVPELTNHPSRNGFDLSMKNSFSAKAGELLPIFHRTCVPKEKFKISIQHRTVTDPLETSAFTRFTEYFDFFFVPYDQLYRNANSVLTQNTRNPQIASSPGDSSPIGTHLPWINLWDIVGPFPNSSGYAPLFRRVLTSSGNTTTYQGFNVAYDMLKLYNYLGFPYVSEKYLSTDVEQYLASGTALTDPIDPSYLPPLPNNRPYSILPHAAYQKIYYDHYRFPQWELNKPQNYNFDYLGSDCQFTRSMILSNAEYDQLSSRLDNLFTLRHCNYPKDLFFGMLPSPQYGDVSTVDIFYSDTKGLPTGDTWENLVIQHNGDSDDTTNGLGNLTIPGANNPSIGDEQRIYSQFNILQLRNAKALQRYREVVNTGNQDYRSMVKKIYGVDVPKYASHTVQYLGGFSNTIDVSTVVNNNLDSVNSQATMKGLAEGTDQQNGSIEFTPDDHGILMVIYRVVPLLDYALTSPHFDLLKTEVDDFMNPFFDRLGLQQLPLAYLDDTYRERDYAIGYVPRYFDYKTSVDVVNGNFRTNSSTWIAALDNQYFNQFFKPTGTIQPDPSEGDLPVYSPNKDFFKVNAHLLDSIFFNEATESVDTDQFKINCNISCHAVRGLDYDGLPKGN